MSRIADAVPYVRPTVNRALSKLSGPGDRMTRPEDLQAKVTSFLVPLQVGALDEGFRAQVESGGTPALRAGRVRSTPHWVERQPQVGSSGDAELFKITLHRRGTAVAGHEGEQRSVRRGDLLVLDTRRPYTLVLPDTCDVAVLRLPARMPGPHARRLAEHSGRSLPADRGAAALFARFVSDVGDTPETLAGPGRAALGDALVSLLTAALCEITPERVETPNADLRERVIAYALANLGDPRLSAAGVARRHGISVRYLHKLFAAEDRTFAAWMRHERLLRIKRDLTDPALRNRTAATIARAWGITDPAHLARALKHEFGTTPSVLRP